MKTILKSPGSAIDALCRSVLFKKLRDIKRGRLIIIDQGQRHVFGPAESEFPVETTITVNRSDFYTRVSLGGSNGAGESYADGDWDCADLASLTRIFVANRDTLMTLDNGVGAALQPIERLIHKTRRNTVGKAKENIRAHYDLGNDFFSLFLDETMMYSCGIFKDAQSTLYEASTEKNDRICRKLALKPSDHVLEIGTGWGGFAIHAAKHYGCHITTTTISKAQYDMAQERIKREGVEDRITLLLEDYRNLTGTYDKLVSIEMIEAVGLDHLDEYFDVCSKRLAPHGTMMLQGIIIRDRYYEAAKKSVDFIKKHIFPGSGIPSVGALVKNSAAADLRLFHQEDLTAHYVRTLRSWSERLESRKTDFLNLGYPEKLYRLWQFYFGYCEGGFKENSIGLVQMMFTKQDHHHESILGAI